MKTFASAAVWASLWLACSSGQASTVSASELKLPVRYHHQEHELSCEAAALAMVLGSYGIPVTEAQILGLMPVDRTPRKNGVWGDPNAAFVGDVDGEMGSTGYGIHWPALARLASRWGRSEAIEGGALSDLIDHLRKGRPVIVWGLDRSHEVMRWKTPAGRQIAVPKGEHTRVLYGFKGDPARPEGVFLMDPNAGPLFWPTDRFLRDWNSFGRAGVVIYRERAPEPASPPASTSRPG